MGSTAIRSAVAFPGLRLTGVITSSADKAGRDAGTFALLESPTGVVATTDVDAALAECDAVAYMASGDIRPEERQRHRAVPARRRARRHALAVLALRPSLRTAGVGGPSCAPDWPQPDQGAGDHRVIVHGDPELTLVSRADVPGGTRADGGNTTAANRLLGAIGWLATQKPGIYDGLDVPLHPPLPPEVEAERWASD